MSTKPSKAEMFAELFQARTGKPLEAVLALLPAADRKAFAELLPLSPKSIETRYKRMQTPGTEHYRTPEERRTAARAAAKARADGKTQRATAAAIGARSYQEVQRLFKEHPADEIAAQIAKRLDDSDSQREIPPLPGYVK